MSADVSFDKSIFLIQAGIFAGSYFVLRGLVLGPYSILLKERVARSSLLKSKAHAEQEVALRMREEYEAFMRDERKGIQQWSDEERKNILDEERQIVQSARDGANSKIKGIRTRLEQEVTEVRKGLMPKAVEFASQLASTILGKKVVVLGQPIELTSKEVSLS